MYDTNTGYAISQQKIYKITNGEIINFLENKEIESIYLHPNPTSDYLFVNSNKLKSIYTLSGQLLFSTNEQTIDVRHLAKGSYILKEENKSIQWLKE